MTFPLDPLVAVTHADPYPYYADLVARQPIYRDDALGLWVASSADAVTAVLTSDLCRVRPPAEPVPKTLLGSAAADVFRHLVRMNDGQGHSPFKDAVSAALKGLDAARVAGESTKWAQHLLSESGEDRTAAFLADFAFRLPVYVVATLLGVPEEKVSQTCQWIDQYVRGVAPAAGPEQVEQGKTAAAHLLDLFGTLLRESPQEPSLLIALAHAATEVGRADTDVIIANGIGLMSQAYEATAGLIGNTLVTLADNQQVREQVQADPRLLREVVQEVSRYDAPIQNTRRFVARDGIVAGREMKAGDAILVVLAAANRDPSANPNPARFDLFRERRRMFTFGLGVHACPGEALATTITEVGIEHLLAAGTTVRRARTPLVYRSSLNARIPFA
jgi:cytochrome P450